MKPVARDGFLERNLVVKLVVMVVEILRINDKDGFSIWNKTMLV